MPKGSVRAGRVCLVDPDTGERFSMGYSDAELDVILHRLMSDVLAGKRGHAGKCMDAVCALRLKKKFPHPVFLVHVTRSRAYVVDQVDAEGRPIHCVRYVINTTDRESIKAWDKGRGAGARMVKLSAPTGKLRMGQRKFPPGHPNKGTGRKTVHRTTQVLRKGARARMLAAGLLDTGPVKVAS